MRVVVCAKEVLDPDAVNNYALEGRLVIGDDGLSLTQTTIPRLMNAYDEQAIEAALKLRDQGVDISLAVVSVGEEPGGILKHAMAMGADEIVHIKSEHKDPHAVGELLGAHLGAEAVPELILCGRQASDDDQGVVPAVIAEGLGLPLVTVARAVECCRVGGSAGLRVTRVTPDGDEVVETALPAVVTISSEIGEARYPTMAGKMAARRKQAALIDGAGLVEGEKLQPKVRPVRQFVPLIQGDCEFIDGDSPAELAAALVETLRQEKVL